MMVGATKWLCNDLATTALKSFSAEYVAKLPALTGHFGEA